MKSLLTASLLLASMTASAQCMKLEKRMDMIISEYGGEEFCTNKTINETRDPYKPDRPLTSKCEMYYFTLKKKDSYQRELLDEMLRAMETEGREDPNCYSFNTMSETSDGDVVGEIRRLMIGEDPENFIEIGKDYNHFYNVNAIDTADASKSHRYAYAVEWREKGKTIDLRYIVTYAKIPPVTSSITSQRSSFLDLGKAHVKPGDRITIKGPARFQWDGKDYPIEKMDSVIRDAEKRMKSEEQEMGKDILRFKQKFQKDGTLVLWADTLDHDTDPVTDVIIRLQQGSDVTANDLLCDDNILLIFSKLKDQYINGNNHEFNAISIYSLCKRARSFGYFKIESSKGMLKQLKDEIRELISTGSNDKAVLYYLQHALLELEMIK